MAITKTDLTSGSSATDATSYTTASITPTANRLVLLATHHEPSASTVTPAVSGNGLIWVLVATRGWLSLFRTLGTSPSAGVVTIDFGSGNTQKHCSWSVVEFIDIDTGGTNGSAAIVQSATNHTDNTTSITVALAAFQSVDNATYGAFIDTTSQDQVPGSGFTQIHEVTVESRRLMTEWRADNDTTVDASAAANGYRDAIAVEIKASGGAQGGGGGGEPAPGTRDPFDWPYAQDSPWNMPIGTGAIFGAPGGNWPVTAEGSLSPIDSYFADGARAIRFYRATTADSVKNTLVTSSGHDPKINPDPDNANFCTDLTVPSTVQFRVPDDAVPGDLPFNAANGWPDAPMTVYDPDGDHIWEMYHTRHDTNGIDWKVDNLFKNQIRGSGWPSRTGAWPNCHHAVKASGASMVAGAVRPGDFATTTSLKHALAIAVSGNLLNRNAPAGRSFTWPATGSDPPTGYSTVGTVFMGSLLAIPSSVDLSTITWNTTAGRAIANALQLYGAYATDGTSNPNNVIFAIDSEALSEMPAQTGTYASPGPFGQDIRRAIALLKVVSNNGPSSVGGGGTPLTTLAPAFGTATATVPAAPSGLGASSIMDTTALLSWTNNDAGEATSTEVEYKKAVDSAWTAITGLGAGLASYTLNPPLIASTEYNARVRKRDADGPSNWSSVTGGGTFVIFTTTPTPAPPAVPSPCTATTTTYDKVTVDWVNVAAETSYNLEVSKNSGAWTTVDAAIAADTATYAYTDASPASGSNFYKFRVQSIGANGASAFTESAEVQTPPKAVPAVGQSAFSPASIGEWSRSVYTDDAAYRLIAITEAFNASPFLRETVLQVAISSLSGAKEGALYQPLASMSDVYLFVPIALADGFAGPAGDFVTIAQLHDAVNDKILAAIRINGTTNVLQLNSEATGATFPQTIISVVTDDTVHTVKVHVTTGASGVLQVWYDDVLVVDLSSLTMTGWNVTQLRYLGVRVPANWAGTWRVRHPNVDNQNIIVPILVQPGQFPTVLTKRSSQAQFLGNPTFSGSPTFPS